MIVTAQRRMSHKDAMAAYVGHAVLEPPAATVLSSPTDTDPTTVADADTGATVAIITRLPTARLNTLRWACTTVGMQAVARMSGKAGGRTAKRGGGRTFGYSPRRVVNGRESCRVALVEVDHPRQHRILMELGGWLTGAFEQMMPDRAQADAAIVHRVKPDWLLDENALWTSGVINAQAELPYHVDGANFHTWSAMPTLRYGVAGGMLHLPEYDITFPCGDGDVTWFCGRDLVHGVTPMRTRKPNGYRFSVVYYALQGMLNCADYAEESAKAARVRTERERKIAADAEAGLPRDHAWQTDPDTIDPMYVSGRPSRKPPTP